MRAEFNERINQMAQHQERTQTALDALRVQTTQSFSAHNVRLESMGQQGPGGGRRDDHDMMFVNLKNLIPPTYTNSKTDSFRI